MGVILLSSTQTDYRLSDDLLGPVLAILDAYIDPYLAKGLVSAGCVNKLAIEGKRLQLGLVYPYPCMTQYRDTVMALTPATLATSFKFGFLLISLALQSFT